MSSWVFSFILVEILTHKTDCLEIKFTKICRFGHGNEGWCNLGLIKIAECQWHFYEESDDDDSDIAFYVHCDGCDREIEFEWSHPDRGSRIWPVECEGFNSWKSWPETRYKEKWAKKNWIRPDK